MIFTRISKASRPSSAIAMALVLAATGAIGMTALETPAFAQKKNKKQEAGKPEYSKAFVEAFQPINAIQSAETPDWAAVPALVPALLATVQSDDEKSVAGRVLLNTGINLKDNDMQLRGIEMLIDSGKTGETPVGQLQFVRYQLYNDRGDVDNARLALEGAIAAGYTTQATMADGSTRTLGTAEMQRMIAELYFNADRVPEGIAYVSGLLDGYASSGEKPPENLIRAALAQAYAKNMGAESARYVAMLAQNYPSPTIWGDAVIITLNSQEYAKPDALDLLRLSRRMNVYNDTRILGEYVELLDSRRYPGEVLAAIDGGFALSNIDKSDPYLVEVRRDAASRVDADRRGLDALVSDARKSGATLKTLVVAGDTMLSYDRPAEAEEFYTRALGMSGVETPVVLTRLGIAQYDQGNYSAAVDTFRKVEGARRDIANLWALYSAQKGAM